MELLVTAPGSAAPGDEAAVSIRVTNHSQVSVDAVLVTLALPGSVLVLDSEPAVTQLDGVVSWPVVSTLRPGPKRIAHPQRQVRGDGGRADPRFCDWVYCGRRTGQ